jgi:hypothetical protein
MSYEQWAISSEQLVNSKWQLAEPIQLSDDRGGKEKTYGLLYKCFNSFGAFDLFYSCGE